MILPPRRPSSAVMTALQRESLMRSRRLSALKPREDHVVHGADAGAGQHGVDRLQDHGHVDGDPVALLDPMVAQHVGQAADLPLEFPVVHRAAFARGVGFPDQGHLIALGGDMPVHAVVADVQPAVEEPLDLAVFPVEFAHPAERVEPVQLPVGLLAPEGFRLADAPVVHPPVVLERSHVSPCAAGGGRWIDGFTVCAFRGLGHGCSIQRRDVVGESLHSFWLSMNT